MREVLEELMQWWRADAEVGLATLVNTSGSAPRQPGAAMLVAPGGAAIGSVSGGCVESAVYELAVETGLSGSPVLQRFGEPTEDTVGEPTLTCGGVVDVFVERVSRQTFPELAAVADDINAGRPVAVATVVADSDAARVGRRVVVRPQVAEQPDQGSVGNAALDAQIAADVRALLADGESGVLTYRPSGQREAELTQVFAAIYLPRPRMIVFGAVDFAAVCAQIGSLLGYWVTVCDARPVFATTARNPDADEIVVDWPHRYLAAEAEAGRLDGRSVLCVLTHDLKFDVPLLEVALELPVGYVGAMGSRRTHTDRLKRLREAGLNEQQLARLSSPIGLDLGAHTPEETAVSIAAEIILLRRGGAGRRLSETDGPIHRTGRPENQLAAVALASVSDDESE